MSPRQYELHLQGGTRQQHLWRLQRWQLWHIPLFIPHTKHSHALIIICGEILISTCPSMLLFPSQPPCSLHTAVLTTSAHCVFSVLTALGAASGALWCQSQKLFLTPVQSLEILTHREKFAAKGSFFHKSRIRDRLFPSSGLLSFRWVLEISWVFVPKPSPLLSWASWLLLTTGTAGTATGHGWQPKTLEKLSSQLVQNTPALLSHTRKCLVLARPERGSSASFLHHLPNTATNNQASHPPPKYFCSSFKRFYLLNWKRYSEYFWCIFLFHQKVPFWDI